MSKTKKYNLYENGVLIIENQPRKVIVKKLGCQNLSIGDYIAKGHTYKGKYTFEECEIEQTETEDTAFAKEWNAVRAKFKNVIWVKAGGKRLVVPK